MIDLYKIKYFYTLNSLSMLFDKNNKIKLNMLYDELLADDVIFSDPFSTIYNKKDFIMNFNILAIVGNKIEFIIDGIYENNKINKTNKNTKNNKIKIYIIKSRAIYHTIIPSLSFTTINYNEVHIKNDKIVKYTEVWNLNELNVFKIIIYYLFSLLNYLLTIISYLFTPK